MQEAAFPAFLGVPLLAMVCLKNTEGSDPVHSFHKDSAPFSSPETGPLHKAVGKRYGYWIGFSDASKQSLFIPHQTRQEIDREYRSGPTPELRPSVLVSAFY